MTGRFDDDSLGAAPQNAKGLHIGSIEANNINLQLRSNNAGSKPASEANFHAIRLLSR